MRLGTAGKRDLRFAADHAEDVATVRNGGEPASQGKHSKLDLIVSHTRKRPVDRQGRRPRGELGVGRNGDAGNVLLPLDAGVGTIPARTELVANPDGVNITTRRVLVPVNRFEGPPANGRSRKSGGVFDEGDWIGEQENL